MSMKLIKIKRFEILDQKDRLLAEFDTSEEVEHFFEDIRESAAENYSVRGLDENNLLIDVWYIQDIISGNFKDDVEKTKKETRSI